MVTDFGTDMGYPLLQLCFREFTLARTPHSQDINQREQRVQLFVGPHRDRYRSVKRFVCAAFDLAITIRPHRNQITVQERGELGVFQLRAGPRSWHTSDDFSQSCGKSERSVDNEPQQVPPLYLLLGLNEQARIAETRNGSMHLRQAHSKRL